MVAKLSKREKHVTVEEVLSRDIARVREKVSIQILFSQTPHHFEEQEAAKSIHITPIMRDKREHTSQDDSE